MFKFDFRANLKLVVGVLIFMVLIVHMPIVRFFILLGGYLGLWLFVHVRQQRREEALMAGRQPD